MAVDYSWQVEEYLASTDFAMAQELYDKGLIYLANRNLHLYGYALGVVVGEDDKTVIGLNILKTSDPDGIWFDEDSEREGRGKLFG